MNEHIELAKNQRLFFETHATKAYDFRINQLKKLKKAISSSENEIIEALRKDLNKPEFEAYATEIGIIYDEINFSINNLSDWMQKQEVNTPLLHFPSESFIVNEPLGVVLIIAPWNYPFQLTIGPLIGAIAAGNCAILKPSEFTPNTSAILSKIIAENFDKNYVALVEGEGHLTIPTLMENFVFDHVFFTGSTAVGKNIAQLAAKNLVPTTLELGGKSPAIIHEDANLKVAAKRIIWGKFINAGQTCVAPDYLLIHENIKAEFVQLLKSEIAELSLESKNFTKIINQKRFDVLKTYLAEGSIIIGGEVDEKVLYISPTLIENLDKNAKVMQDEIFGPILPIFSYKNLTEVFEFVQTHKNPLALYLFTNNDKTEEEILTKIPFGGGCINNTLIHLGNPELPFGGRGNSGMGSYHGKFGFNVFSHQKAIIKTATWLDPSIKYPPYSELKTKLIKMVMK